MNIKLEQLHACLDKLEEQEAALLAWGDTGAFFSEDELLSLFEDILPEHDPYDVLMELTQHAMLIEVPHSEGLTNVYRTRMGESVYLYRNLRQWFLGQKIEASRTLVSDFRFVRRPRSYPKRDQSLADLLPDWLSINDASSSFSVEDPLILLLGSDEASLHYLSGFQARATSSILKAFSEHKNSSAVASGSIICAGTGSGKTLSFYLPALASLAADLCDEATPRVRILAIYPRNELLKDQFMETWSQCRKLDSLMQKKAGRKIRIGGLYGDTPYSWAQAGKDYKTKKPKLGFDLLRCKDTKCSGQMEWNVELSQVKCSRCGHSVAEDEVALTRDSQKDTPPDILFTTTEMLNRTLGDFNSNHLFGLGNKVGPTLVLLDEVHTYAGSSGAQVAYLLRRWMRHAKCRPHFVGLSATLTDAASFFSQLVGAPQKNIELIEPLPEEMIDEGAEYLVVLRGDPVSQTALLSTTIQACMLTRRILDARSGLSRGTWGKKTFVFTDDLDGTNRLYHQLADAEGWRTSKWGLKSINPSLASLRGPQIFQDSSKPLFSNYERVRLGQDWHIGVEAGHFSDEEDRAVISRTSSQDAGVDAKAEIVVATASLEVGFNDPAVGAVVQHKAPRDVASYLQRKGRAGRSRTMRPWMLVVLSEFGRDRVAFQRYEELLSPEIKRQGLPLYNSHIQKMQAAMALLDWLSMELGTVVVWSTLRAPNRTSYSVKNCKAILTLVDKLLKPSNEQDRFKGYLADALQVTHEELNRILWMPPRSVMLEVLPTLKRKLSTNWSVNGHEWTELPHGSSPLPEFIPEALFADLNLPSVFIGLKRGVDDYSEWVDLPLFQALREFAPGRISKRYAVDSDFDADWLAPADFVPEPDTNQECNFDVVEAFGEQLQDEDTVFSDTNENLTVLRPSSIYTRRLDTKSGLSEKSNSQHAWQSKFYVPTTVEKHEPPSGSWSKYLVDVSFCLHQQMTPVEVLRFSTETNSTLRFSNGAATKVKFSWQKNDQPVAIGAKQWVDGMRLRFAITDQVIVEMLEDTQILQGVRPVYFRHLVDQLDIFNGDIFQANWVAECYLAAVAAELLRLPSGDDYSIENALTNLHTGDGVERLKAIPQSLFQSDEQLYSGSEQKLQEVLRGLLDNDDLLLSLRACAQALFFEAKELPGLFEWLKTVLADTLAATAQQFMYVLLPDVGEQVVFADAFWDEGYLNVWLSESEVGGNGIISRLEGAYFEDPLRVLNVFSNSLEPSDYEQVDFDLFSLLELAVQNTDLADSLAKIRACSDLQRRREASSDLHKTLLNEGFVLSHSFLSILYSRVLRPGSDKGTDQTLFDLLEQWRGLESSSGIEWGLNIISHALSKNALSTAASSSEVFQGLCRNQGLLWPRGNAIRQSEMSYYNPFKVGATTTERLIGKFLFSELGASVKFDAEYLQELHRVLINMGQVDLLIQRKNISSLSKIITEIQLNPVEHLGLLLYPRIASVKRSERNIVLRVELAEANY